MKEEWRPVKGFEGYYEVSNVGRVRSIDRIIKGRNNISYNYKGKLLSPGISFCNNNPRHIVALTKDCKQYVKMVATLMAEAFLPKPKRAILRFKDKNSFNISLSNLYWRNLDAPKIKVHKKKPEYKFGKLVLDTLTGKLYISYKQASDYTGIHRLTIRKSVMGLSDNKRFIRGTL